MKAKSMSLALATLALLSTTSAFAQDVVVESAAPVVTTTSGATCAPGFIGSASNVLTAPVSFGTNLVDNIFNPPGSWFELNVLGAGFSLGGRRNVVQTNGIPSAYYLNGAAPNLIGDRGFYRTSNYAAVIPGSVSLGNARPVQAITEGPKPMFHLDLFGGRLLRFGPDINPSLDMRID